MGDIADWMYDQAEAAFLSGESHEHFDDEIFCKYCGKGPFSWIETCDGWRLEDDNGIHSCEEFFKAKLKNR